MPSITQRLVGHWGEFGGGGGEEREREAGHFFQKFSVFCSVKMGGKEEDEQCRSKRHRSDLPPFIYLFIYIYMKRRRFE